jgi:small subunit ribosomal protein S17
MSTQKSPAQAATSTKASSKAAAPKAAKTAAPAAAPAQAAPAAAPAAKKAPAQAAASATAAADERGSRRHMIGIVTSDKMNKTVVVQVTRRVREPKFGKYTVHQAKYKAHSEDNGAHVGDKVEIVESRPLSKDKRWRVVKLIERARRAQ